VRGMEGVTIKSKKKISITQVRFKARAHRKPKIPVQQHISGLTSNVFDFRPPNRSNHPVQCFRTLD